MRPQSEINAEIERLMPEREARVHRIEKTFAVCEDTAKREMEGNMTNPSIQAAIAMREAAAKAIDNSICDVAENCEIFMYHRDYFVAIVRALPLPESAPDPQAATIARLSAELETASNSVLDALNHLDPIVHALGIEDSFKTPLEAIAEKDAAIARLSAELAAAREALAPFAEVADWAERNKVDLLKHDMLLRCPDGGIAGHLQVQSPDFIAARAVLAKLSEKEPNP
jgi:hypothetical protein